MYYKAREAALKNGGPFHIAAFTRSRKGLIGVNNERRLTSQFTKRYPNSDRTYHEIHAEVALLLRLREVPESIQVVRFFKDGTPTMARPCVHCQNFLRLKGVKRIRYTNWQGEWEWLTL